MFSDIWDMQLTTPTQTRQCPFCAETILAAAVKCRYCGEFLNTERAKALLRGNSGPDAGNQDSAQDQPANPSEVVFAGRPTLWVMAGAFLKGGLLLAVAGLLVFWHIERIAALKLSTEYAAVFGKYRLLLGLGLGLVVIMVLFYKALQLRMTHYEVGADRIEFGRGIFDRKVDNLDMFRVVDIKLRRSVLDCIVGVGTVLLTTTDKSHPEFMFEKVRDSRELYDAVKKASLSADRRTNVIHME
ncbi:MAG: PH domain-containing protein [Sedimentisphaerales bacterium]|nr:PH domain-containing protein [Sedimentisphaerales bacterium]